MTAINSPFLAHNYHHRSIRRAPRRDHTPHWRHLASPPATLRRRGVRLDNITLVPASLLPYKRRYQQLARSLPAGAVLLVLPRRNASQRQLFVQLAHGFAARGHAIASRTAEEVARG